MPATETRRAVTPTEEASQLECEWCGQPATVVITVTTSEGRTDVFPECANHPTKENQA